MEVAAEGCAKGSSLDAGRKAEPSVLGSLNATTVLARAFNSPMSAKHHP